MIILEKASELRKFLENYGVNHLKVGFIPTMGALHAGHISLIHKAKRENQVVVCSIFVNPTQFNDPGDLARYPRTPEADARLLENAGCDVMFIPSVEEVYPDPTLLDMDFGPLEMVMEGFHRPGHFKGVATVVARLFLLVSPDKAYFGEKDFQQLAIIREMTRRLQLGVQITGCPTLREHDGLAMSSRNIHLTDDERRNAAVIYNTLVWTSHSIKTSDTGMVINEAISRINQVAGFRVQYLELVNAETLQSETKWLVSNEQRLCIAVLTSRTRLIDNIAV